MTNQTARWSIPFAVAGLLTALTIGCEPPDPDADPVDQPPQPVDDEEPVDIGPEGPPELDHGGITSIPDDPDLIAEGEDLFLDYGCQACHAVEPDEPSPTGPNLAGVADRREAEWLARMILHPDEMLEEDPVAQELLAEYATPMPDQGVTIEDTEAIVAYLGSLPSEDEPDPEDDPAAEAQ